METNNKTKQNLIIILRWIGVIPCAVAACILAFVILRFGQTFYSDPGSGYSIYVVPIISSFVSGIALIQAGAYVAPSHKKYVSLGLLVLSCVILGIGMSFYITKSLYFELAQYAASLIGTVGGYLMITTEDKNSYQ